MRKLPMAHPQMVRYYPNTGRVEPCYEPNPVPQRAFEEHNQPSEGAGVAVRAAVMSGVGRISWDAVESANPADVAKFSQTFDLGGVLIENAKITKPRPNGRMALTRGLNLSPHYFPNLLQRAGLASSDPGFEFKGLAKESKKSWDVPVPNTKQDFIRFDGSTSQAALESVNDGLSAADKIKKTSQLLNFCTGSSQFCRAACLVFSGQNVVGEGPAAKMRRTYALLVDPVLFTAVLKGQIYNFAKTCEKQNKDAVVRLNLLSDLPWYAICPELLLHFDGSSAKRPKVFWYDYTKTPYFWKTPEYQRVRDVLDLTFSFSGGNVNETKAALKAGYRVAVVFAPLDPERSASAKTRTTFREIISSGLVDREGYINLFDGRWEIVDGDESDYRVDDPAPSIVSLNFKDPSIAFRGKYEEGSAEEQFSKRIGTAVESARKGFGEQVPRSELLDEWNEVRTKLEPWTHLFGREKTKKSPDIEALLPGMSTQDFTPEALLDIYRAYTEIKKEGGGKLSAPVLAKMVAPLAERLATPWRGRTATPNSASNPDEVAVTMFTVPGTNLIIGPHVPTIVNDK